MKIFLHNFNPNSNSGPNKFCRQLFMVLIKEFGVKIVESQNEADLEFASINFIKEPIKPSVVRLDGIYFNSDQDFESQNIPIKYTYDNASSAIFQTSFNKELIEKWFGSKKTSFVINNGPDEVIIDNLKALHLDGLEDKDIWCCASSWRPHKRLKDNLDYFCENASKDAIMIVAGANADSEIINKYSKLSGNRVFYAGELDYNTLVSLFKRASTLVHLAFLDHCPNVVVDAQYAGCKIICSSTGGTSEVVYNGRVIQEDQWNFEPIKLYDPPEMNFKNFELVDADKKDSLRNIAKKYYEAFQKTVMACDS